MSTYTFTVPGPPVGKERARKGQRGNFYTPQKTKDYEELVAFKALATGMKPTLAICHLDVKWCVPPPGDDIDEEYLQVTLAQTDDLPPKYPKKKPDGDNILKSVADALNCVAYLDDSQLWWWSLGRETW